MVFCRLICSSCRRASVSIELRLRQIDLRFRRHVARLGIVERLLGEQLALEEVLRALEVQLGDLEVGLALPDGGLRHFERGLGWAHLLEDFAIFDLGHHLAAPDGVAQLHVDAQQTAAGLRRDLDGLQADQVADDGEVRGEVAALGGAQFHRHAACAGPPPPPPGRRSRRRQASRRRRPAAAAPALPRPAGLATRRRGVSSLEKTPKYAAPPAATATHDPDHQKFTHNSPHQPFDPQDHRSPDQQFDQIPARRRGCPAAAATAAGGRLLGAFEIDERLAIVGQRAQLGVLPHRADRAAPARRRSWW